MGGLLAVGLNLFIWSFEMSFSCSRSFSYLVIFLSVGYLNREEDNQRTEGSGTEEASRPHTAREAAEEPQATAFIPYVAGLSEDVRRVCRKYNIRTVFRSASTLHGQLTRVKDQDPLEKKSGVVYQIPCSCGDVCMGKQRDPHKGAQSCH